MRLEMPTSKFRIFKSLAVFGAVGMSSLIATGASAAEDSEFTLSGGVTLASEYVFRGVSQSEEDPALQGTFILEHASGVYAAVWGSSGKFNDGAGNLELDYTVGYTHYLSGVMLDFSVTYYTFPSDARKGDYFEFLGKAGYDFGRVILSAGAAYVPSGQNAYGNEDAIYVFGDVMVPIPNTKITAIGHLGYEDFGGGSNKLDWRLGLATNLFGLDLEVSYVDTDLKDVDEADSRILLTLGKSF